MEGRELRLGPFPAVAWLWDLVPLCHIAEGEVLPLRAQLGNLALWPFLGPLAEPQSSEEVLFWWQQPRSQGGRTAGTQPKNLPSDPGSLLDQLL